MQNHTVHLGSATPLSSQAGPRAPAHCGQTRLSAAPPPDTVPWPTCQSPPPLCVPAAGRRVALLWPDPPSPSFCPPLPRRRLAVQNAPKCCRSSVTHSSPPPSRAPHLSPRSLCLDHCLQPLEAPPSLEFRPSAATVRHFLVSSSPSLQSSQFLAIFSPLAPPE
jgi:hypothetical protein